MIPSPFTLNDKILLKAINLKRYYTLGGMQVRALDGIDLRVQEGEFLVLVGASGSGKTTLLNLLGGLDKPTAGEIQTLYGELSTLSSRSLARYRANDIGMIFQSFNLISHRTALSNVEAALYFNGTSKRDRIRRSREMLEKLGLGDRLHHRPDDLSGGEQQRVAIARALVKNPKILFADEPTGNLDRNNAFAIAAILREWNHNGGTVILVTHNLELAQELSNRILKMDYGRFIDYDSTGAET